MRWYGSTKPVSSQVSSLGFFGEPCPIIFSSSHLSPESIATGGIIIIPCHTLHHMTFQLIHVYTCPFYMLFGWYMECTDLLTISALCTVQRSVFYRDYKKVNTEKSILHASRNVCIMSRDKCERCGTIWDVRIYGYLSITNAFCTVSTLLLLCSLDDISLFHSQLFLVYTCCSVLHWTFFFHLLFCRVLSRICVQKVCTLQSKIASLLKWLDNASLALQRFLSEPKCTVKCNQ